jgi:trans-aconitate 2-methyltransferase
MASIPVESPKLVYDLGCGTGTATVLLKQRWPEAHVTGVDSSAAMLERARTSDADIRWEERDLASWRPKEPCDLLYSNAVFHWLDEHESLFPRLLEGLRPGGVLAVQMPSNFAAPTHTAIAETVREGGWRESLEPYLREDPVRPATGYYAILSPHTANLNLWETTYYHVLDGDNPVVEWTKGSILRPLLDQLMEPEAQRFLEVYGERVRAAYPRRADGKTVLPFKRLFFIATK